MENDNAKMKGAVIFGIIIALLLLVILNWVARPKRGGENNEKAAIRIGSTRIKVDIADDLMEQVQGLSGRDSVCDGCGMLFVYDQPQAVTFWMKDMKFALDIIYIRDKKIVKIFENVPPPSQTGGVPKVVSSRESANAVLEVNGGFSRKHGIKAGDRIELK